jgi:glycosyltransferase involved in cell wall biosynthesis
MMKKKLTAIILTFNEEKHIERCIKSLKNVVDDIFVVDSYSKDSTIELAEALGARVVLRKWKNYADQFNWALTQLEATRSGWILRIDADEYLTSGLAEEINSNLHSIDEGINGIYCGRKMKFCGADINYGGLFPIRVLRLLRLGMGECENRWMDEHIKVKGNTYQFKNDIIDDNLNNISWWIEKHNNYASREAIDLLNLEFHFMPRDSVASLKAVQEASIKRWIKEVIYSRLPLGTRSFVYFFYRYIIRVGFLEKPPASSFHFLQGFWYRYLVDVKVAEVKRDMKKNNLNIVQSIHKVLGIDLMKH